MANLTENAIWHDGIYQIERNDPVSGGKDGITNKPLQQLTDRTVYLKEQNAKIKELIDKGGVGGIGGAITSLKTASLCYQ
ncbi:hypothetical protein PT273_08865 [Orbaceae bacterium ESL0727]|nr:hypothetical protein [Orbaceae bacterium ESL0727]